MELPAKETKATYSFRTHNDAAWAAQFRDPTTIGAIADEIIECSVDGSIEQAWGYVHRAWAHRFVRDIQASLSAISTAERFFSAHMHESGLASCYELRARERLELGDEKGARALMAKSAAIPKERRSVWEQMGAHKVEFAIANRFSKSEEALRVISREIVVARLTNDDAVIGQSLSMLGGKHAELNNYETALTYCKEAYRRTQAFKPATAWYISALNLLLVYNGIGDRRAARSLADELMAFDHLIYPSIREQSNILYARALLLDEDLLGAQAALERSRNAVATRNNVTEWTAAQVEVLVAGQAWQSARELCEHWIAITPREDKSLSPYDALRIYRAAAKSSESLGDLRAALDHERKAVEYNEIELGRAALARRIALEVEFDFDRERAARDEADRKRVESEAERSRLDELNRKLDVALQTRTRFLAAASHDLRQPAHALALYAQALEHETSRPALVDLSKRMRATVGSLSNMFDGLLELARLDAGAVKPQQDVFDLNELLARLSTEYADRLTHANALLRFHRTEGDCFVRSDAVLVERILRNLIGNAVKYAGEGNILVALRKRESMLAIEVRDAGPGMNTEELRHIFDEFYRASSANERRDGLGLGLSIVERFARLLGAQISVRSVPGRGTTFTLAMPITQLVSRPVKTTDVEARTVASITRRIAVIDDDPDARESMALVLTQWGHDCVAGESADEVIASARRAQWTPDALICDFQLRARVAIADIAALRETFGAALPVLVVSGSHDAQATITEHVPDAAYLPKPIRPLRLKSWLASIGKK